MERVGERNMADAMAQPFFFRVGAWRAIDPWIYGQQRPYALAGRAPTRGGIYCPRH